MFKKKKLNRNEKSREENLENSLLNGRFQSFLAIFPVTKQQVKESERRDWYGPAEIVEEFRGREAVFQCSTRGAVDARHGWAGFVIFELYHRLNKKKNPNKKKISVFRRRRKRSSSSLRWFFLRPKEPRRDRDLQQSRASSGYLRRFPRFDEFSSIIGLGFYRDPVSANTQPVNIIINQYDYEVMNNYELCSTHYILHSTYLSKRGRQNLVNIAFLGKKLVISIAY